MLWHIERTLTPCCAESISQTGLGEASFVSLGPPYIDDAAPHGMKTRWLAFFFMMLPIGFAIGVIFGKRVSDSLGWRLPMAIVSIAGVRCHPLPATRGARAPAWSLVAEIERLAG